jgi:hypothetical protein
MNRKIIPVSHVQLTSLDLDAFVRQAKALNQQNRERFTSPFPKRPSRWISHYQQNLENLRRNGVTPISMASTYSYKKPGHHRPGATSCALSIAIFLIMPCPPWIPL